MAGPVYPREAFKLPPGTRYESPRGPAIVERDGTMLKLRHIASGEVMAMISDVPVRVRKVLPGRPPAKRRNPARELDEEGEDAVDMFKRFHRFEPRKIGDFSAGFAIPKTVKELGSATFVTYSSNKVDPSTLRRPQKPVDYIHEHDAGVKLYVPDGPVTVPAWLADAQALALLGACTGIGYKLGGEALESESTRPYPELYTIPSGKALIVVQDKKMVVAMMWGGGLGVEGRGIVG